MTTTKNRVSIKQSIIIFIKHRILDRLKRKIKELLFNMSIQYIRYYSKDSSDDEFEESYMNDKVKQNKRLSTIFKRDNKYNYLNSFIKHGIYYIGGDNKIISRNMGNWSGGIFVISDDGSDIYYFHKDWIKDINTFNKQSFIINVVELEYPKDWWLSFCKESDLKEYMKYYEFKKDYKQLEKELSFDKGKHKEEILTRIETIKKFYKNETSNNK